MMKTTKDNQTYSPNLLQESFLEVEGHQVYYAEWGKPDGIPILFVHGGPGGGTDPSCVRFFDPDYYRIILVDQRGCGKSEPNAALMHNTTDHLIADFESIRRNLKIERWILFGGSWGSTLAIAYAKKHPSAIIQLVLRGLFLARQQDYDWLYHHGASEFFPEAWQRFKGHVQSAHDIISAYGTLLHSEDDVIRQEAAKAWCLWEAEVSCLQQSAQVIASMADSDNTYALAAIEHHYFSNHCFMSFDYLCTPDPKLAKMPMTVVHGRYDLCCQLSNATAWKACYPQTKLHIVEAAGHAMLEKGIEACLVDVCDEIKGAL